MIKVICINNDDYPVSLEVGKEYEVFEIHPKGLIQICDETNELYYYEKNIFSPIICS